MIQSAEELVAQIRKVLDMPQDEMSDEACLLEIWGLLQEYDANNSAKQN